MSLLLGINRSKLSGSLYGESVRQKKKKKYKKKTGIFQSKPGVICKVESINRTIFGYIFKR